MRKVLHDYGKKNGVWEAVHGTTVWLPSSDGPCVEMWGHRPTQTEVLAAAKGMVEYDKGMWLRWRMGDPKLPDPNFGSILLELSSMSMARTWSRLDELRASWDRFHAEWDERRFGTE